MHTDAPWHVVHMWDGWHGIEIRHNDTSLFCIRPNGHNAKHGEANARLAAAAPELLAACQEAGGALDMVLNSSNLDAAMSEVEIAINTIRAAILKATA